MKEIIIDTRAYPVPIPLRGYETKINKHESIYCILESKEVAINVEDLKEWIKDSAILYQEIMGLIEEVGE